MQDNQTPQNNSQDHQFPVVRKVKVLDILSWLKHAINDVKQAKLASIFYGVVFASAGLIMHTVLFEASWLLSGVTTGFLLVGPFLAMGLYDLSRRLELGEQPKLLPTLTAWRTNMMNIGIFAGVLVVILLIWARASLVIFALFFQGGLPTFIEIVHAVINVEQPSFALVYFAVGGFFAAFVFSVSVIAIPLMADRNTDAITAAIASLVAVVRNPMAMMVWALCIVVLTVFGFATYFVGLVITMPIVGHATWHAYRDLIA